MIHEYLSQNKISIGKSFENKIRNCFFPYFQRNFSRIEERESIYTNSIFHAIKIQALKYVEESTAEYQNTSKPKPSVSSKVSPNPNSIPKYKSKADRSRNYSNDSSLKKP